MEEKLQVRKEVVIETSPDKVFKALTDENELSKWFPDNAVFEPRQGGKIRFTFHPSEKEHPDEVNVDGKVVEIIPDKKLVYTWEPHPKNDFPPTTVTWTLEEIEPQKTKVTLVHVGFASKDKETEFHKTDAGWSHFLPRLAKHAVKL